MGNSWEPAKTKGTRRYKTKTHTQNKVTLLQGLVFKRPHPCKPGKRQVRACQPSDKKAKGQWQYPKPCTGLVKKADIRTYIQLGLSLTNLHLPGFDSSPGTSGFGQNRNEWRNRKLSGRFPFKPSQERLPARKSQVTLTWFGLVVVSTFSI